MDHQNYGAKADKKIQLTLQTFHSHSAGHNLESVKKSDNEIIIKMIEVSTRIYICKELANQADQNMNRCVELSGLTHETREFKKQHQIIRAGSSTVELVKHVD